MSLPKTLKLAQERLDKAEAEFGLHIQELVNSLTSEKEYKGLYEDKLVSSAVKASKQVYNARQQFLNYEQDFENTLEREEKASKIIEDHDIAPNTVQYRRAYETAGAITSRHGRLDSQIKAISKVMENNGQEGLMSQIREQHPWYVEPEEAEGFQKASNM